MNFVVLSAALSSSNANLYLISRTLFSLARGGFVPPALGAVTKRGAPVNALLVSSVMQGAAGEGTFPVLAGFHWIRRYYAQYATPLTPRAIAFGQLAWNATHALAVGAIFCVVIVLFGAAATPGILWSVPIGVLTNRELVRLVDPSPVGVR